MTSDVHVTGEVSMTSDIWVTYEVWKTIAVWVTSVYSFNLKISNTGWQTDRNPATNRNMHNKQTNKQTKET